MAMSSVITLLIITLKAWQAGWLWMWNSWSLLTWTVVRACLRPAALCFSPSFLSKCSIALSSLFASPAKSPSSLPSPAGAAAPPFAAGHAAWRETHRTHHMQGQRGGDQQVGTHIRSKYSCGVMYKKLSKEGLFIMFYEHIIYNINLLIKHSILFIMTPYEVSLTDRPVSPLLDVELLLGQSSLDLSPDSSSQESTVWTLQPWILVMPVLLVLCEFQDFVSGSFLIQSPQGQMVWRLWRRELRSLFDTEMTKISFSVLSLYPDWLAQL